MSVVCLCAVLSVHCLCPLPSSVQSCVCCLAVCNLQSVFSLAVCNLQSVFSLAVCNLQSVFSLAVCNLQSVFSLAVCNIQSIFCLAVCNLVCPLSSSVQSCLSIVYLCAIFSLFQCLTTFECLDSSSADQCTFFILSPVSSSLATAGKGGMFSSSSSSS